MLLQTSPKERLLARINGALENHTITPEQAAQLRQRVGTASPSRLQAALQTPIGDDFLPPGGQTTLGRLGGQIIDGVLTAAGQSLHGLGRGTRARSTVDERGLRTQVQGELSKRPIPGATVVEAVAHRTPAFLMPKAVEELWRALSTQPGVDARVYPSRFGGQDFYTFQSRGPAEPQWRLQVYAESGERVAAGTATPTAEGELTFQWIDRAGRDPSRPTRTLDPFSVEKFWDADSTPAPLAKLSRVLGKIDPRSPARTPQIEAGIVMASLMHDVAYYYGGSEAQKAIADTLFGRQIPYFVGKLDPQAGSRAKVTAAIDVDAVAFGGGFPFNQSYSWSYGFPRPERGYTTLEKGEIQRITKEAQSNFVAVVDAIADGTFQLSEVLRAKLQDAGPSYADPLIAQIKALAKILQAELRGPRRHEIPGFSARAP